MAKTRITVKRKVKLKSSAKPKSDSISGPGPYNLAPSQDRMVAILTILKKEFPDAKCSLYFKSPFQLLVATILSAQCTDERVNKVTPALFNKFATAKDFAQAGRSEIEELIRSTGFYNSKARAIQETAKALVENHGGEVPKDMESLVKLRGVGRKTANVVLGNAYGIPGIPVDTHVKRITHRLGFTKSADPEKIEQDLMKIVPKEDWIDYTHLIIYHGRKTCTARKALCDQCAISQLCPKIDV